MTDLPPPTHDAVPDGEADDHPERHQAPEGWGVADLASGKAVVDTVLPTVIFAVAALRLDAQAAALAALAYSAVVIGYRLLRRQDLRLAVSGVGGVLAGVGLALVSGRATDFFLPNIIGNLLGGVACLLSVVFRRPAVAWTSAALYRWPIEWYWHPRVRPAYGEITALWAAYYLGKGGWQLWLVGQGDVATLAVVRVVLGWPGLAAMLAITYAYISRRLDHLGGPDVEEWRAQQEADRTPPASPEGQRGS